MPSQDNEALNSKRDNHRHLSFAGSRRRVWDALVYAGEDDDEQKGRGDLLHDVAF
jgi:hypothetical protein